MEQAQTDQQERLIALLLANQILKKHQSRYTKNLNPDIPVPYDKQQDLIDSPAVRKVWVSGRRSGKTTGLAIFASQCFKAGLRVLYATPTSDQSDRFWYAVKHYFREDIKEGRVYKRESKRLIEPPEVDENGPRIRAKTAWNADTLRGDWGDIILLDEYNLMDTDVEKVILPMTLDRNAIVIYAFTPNRKDHGYVKYMRAQTDQSGRWAAWNFPSHENPYLSKEALEELVKDMTDEDFRQEILAEFLDSDDSVFKNVSAALYVPTEREVDPSSHYGHIVVAGIDWGKHNDKTALSIGCVNCAKELELHYFNKIEYIYQRDFLLSTLKRWERQLALVLVEGNSIGDVNYEMLVREAFILYDMNPEIFKTLVMGLITKNLIVQKMIHVLARGLWRLIKDDIATLELDVYEQRRTPTNMSTYSAPKKMHDDTVDARGLCIHAATQDFTAEQMQRVRAFERPFRNQGAQAAVRVQRGRFGL